MIFTIIGPIFLLLALGYLSVKLNLLSKLQIAAVGAFVIKVALPALLLQSLSTKDLHEIWFAEYFAVYGGTTFILYVSAFFILSHYFKNSKADTSVLSLGASMSNTGLIGAAVLTLLMGNSAMTYISLVVIIESVFLIPAVLVLAELNSQKSQYVNVLHIIKSTILTLVKNPLFMAVVLGMLCSALKIKLPHQLDQVLLMLGQTASPLALFAIGGGIVGLSLKYVNLQSVYLVVSSNIIFPLMVFLGLTYLTNVRQEMVYAGTIIASLPMPTIFAMLGQAYGLSEKTLTPLLMSTIVGFIVMSGLIALWWA